MNGLAWSIIIIAAIPATGFPLVYAFRPWWRSLTGRGLMAESVGMALLIDLSLAYRVFGHNYPGSEIVRLVVYLLITAGLWLLFLSLLSSRRDD